MRFVDLRRRWPRSDGEGETKGFKSKYAELMSALLGAFMLLVMSGVASAADKDYFVTAPDGVQIAVQESGDPTGPAIVFVHGLLGSHLNWEEQVTSPDLSKYRLITFDLRGHGLSGKPNDAQFYSDGRRWAGDLQAVLEATKARKPVLVGWSLGGAVITNYIAAYGDKDLGGIVYVGGVVELKPELIPAHPDVYAGLASGDLKTHLDAIRQFLALCFSTQPNQTAFERLLANAAMASWSMTSAVSSMTVAAAEGLPAITSPMLMIYGEQDALVMPQPSLARAQALNSHITSRLYAESGHAPFVEEAQRFNRDLAEFALNTSRR
jgi:pimeloyl-ACP methyl ester carboxylesterase